MKVSDAGLEVSNDNDSAAKILKARNIFNPAEELRLPFPVDKSILSARRRRLEKEKSIVVLSQDGPVNSVNLTPGDEIINFKAWLCAVEPMPYDEPETENVVKQTKLDRSSSTSPTHTHIVDEVHIHHKKSWKQSKRNFRALIITAIYFVIGVAFFHAYEGWDILTCVYYIATTAATIGYGDYHPTSDSSRVFAIVYFLIGIIIVINVVGHAMDDFIDFVIFEYHKVSFGDDHTHTATPKEELEVLAARNLSLVLLLIVLVLLGGIFFNHYEGWSYLSSCYFTFVTVMSIGYGDLIVKTAESKIFLIFYMLLTISLVTVAIESFAKIKLMLSTINLKESLLHLKVDRDFLSYIDLDGDQTLTKFEFVVAMLIKTGAVEGDRHIVPLMEKFEELDVSGDGSLSIEDILQNQDKNHLKRRKKGIGKKLKKKMQSFYAGYETYENIVTMAAKEDLVQFGAAAADKKDEEGQAVPPQSGAGIDTTDIEDGRRVVDPHTAAASGETTVYL